MTSTLPSLTCPAPASKSITSVCVFCGSGDGGNPEYREQATALGKALADNGYSLVYGGGSVGLMGAVAKAVIDNGGKAKGIVPEPLYRNGSKQICETIIVPDMHTRKKTMGDHCDAFVVLPGGYGTAEEMLEMITWSQLNIHSKPILVLNTRGFFTPLVEWVNVAVREQFIRPNNANIFVTCNTIDDILQALKTYQAPSSRYGLDWVTNSDGQNGRSMT
ncbi:lysine decarboxylase [Lichtheimia corymbifera JMRC:FSU:9682]|uniref:Lysine decarboxylase n=1 Tax=Lichtheimia corymbifera JMRC:FSU:9682 TaxID=1263082 RepID=A0A068RE46_9FUNG|nr:lysine decarboxylase [Lichtheimia corymbifera JMRC:FSU:9682]